MVLKSIGIGVYIIDFEKSQYNTIECNHFFFFIKYKHRRMLPSKNKKLSETSHEMAKPSWFSFSSEGIEFIVCAILL